MLHWILQGDNLLIRNIGAFSLGKAAEAMAQSFDQLRQKVAISMRVLALQQCVTDILGHVSARIPGTSEMFIRCRGGNERGLLYTDIRQIRRLDFDGKGAGLGDYAAPIELPIHGEIYKARPGIQAVVHAHPYACVMCSILGLELRPVFGAFDALSLALAVRGVPMYPRSILISSSDLATELIAAMGERDCCLMQGHGITAVGPSVEAATLLALGLERLARATLEIAHVGREARTISQQDLEAFDFLVRGGVGAAVPKGVEWIWAHLVQLVKDSVGLPADFGPDKPSKRSRREGRKRRSARP